MEENESDELKEDLEYYAIKCKLKSALKYPDMISLIKDRVDIVNRIWVEAYFLFNLYIIKRLSDDKDILVDSNTIERCVLFVLGKQDEIRTKNLKLSEIEAKIKKIDARLKQKSDKDLLKEKNKLLRKKEIVESFDILNNVYSNIYCKLGDNGLSKFKNIKSITRPFEYLSKQMVVNIKNHITMNFWNFQKRYIRTKILSKLTDLKLKSNIIHSIINCIQYHVNNEYTNIIIKSKHIKNLCKSKPELYANVILIIKDTINSEKSLVPMSLKENITKTNLEKNYKCSLKYFFDILKYLEKDNNYRFSLLPQLSIGYTYIRFDSRFMSTIYDEWINEKLKEIQKTNENTVKKKYNINFKLEKTGIKKFEKYADKYFNRCFKFKEINSSKDNQAISFLTNGYSICILYRKPVIKVQEKNTEKVKLKPGKINLDEYQKNKKIKKGLFDADNINASEEFLNKFHKIGIDPNNGILLYCYSETGNKIKITKNYYNEISHIRKNTKKMKKYISQSDIAKIYKELSDSCYRKTINIKKYSQFIKIYRTNKDIIWNFYNQNKVQSLELDSYINKKKALHTIVRRIIPKYNEPLEFNTSQNKHIDMKLYDDIKNYPILIAFGKGNGNITINNLKKSGPKGPVKAFAFELSKYALTVLTDEYNTSQFCSECQTQQLEHPMLKKTFTQRHKDKNGKRQKNKIEVEYENYNLCYCKNNIHQNDSGVHKIWNRDYNASKNILQTMIKRVTGGKLGVYARKKLDKKIAEDDITISCSQEQPESNERFPNAKVSRKAKTATNKTQQKQPANNPTTENSKIKTQQKVLKQVITRAKKKIL